MRSFTRVLVAVVVGSTPLFAQARPATTTKTTSTTVAAGQTGDFNTGPWYAGPRVWIGNLNGAVAFGGQIEKASRNLASTARASSPAARESTGTPGASTIRSAAATSIPSSRSRSSATTTSSSSSNKKIDPYVGLALVYSVVSASWEWGVASQHQPTGNTTDFAGQAGAALLHQGQPRAPGADRVRVRHAGSRRDVEVLTVRTAVPAHPNFEQRVCPCHLQTQSFADGSQAAFHHACPKCGSAEVRRLSLIYQAGLSTIGTRQEMARAARRRTLSKHAAPPVKKNAVSWSRLGRCGARRRTGQFRASRCRYDHRRRRGGRPRPHWRCARVGLQQRRSIRDCSDLWARSFMCDAAERCSPSRRGCRATPHGVRLSAHETTSRTNSSTSAAVVRKPRMHRRSVNVPRSRVDEMR